MHLPTNATHNNQLMKQGLAKVLTFSKQGLGSKEKHYYPRLKPERVLQGAPLKECIGYRS